MSAHIIEATDATFDAEVLQSSGLTLVDFWAPWCGPCKMIAPILDELADAHPGKVKIVKVNVDDNKESPAKYGVRGIPTILVFVDGELKATEVGAKSKPELEKLIDEHAA